MFLIVSGLAERFPVVLLVRLIENKKFYHGLVRPICIRRIFPTDTPRIFSNASKIFLSCSSLRSLQRIWETGTRLSQDKNSKKSFSKRALSPYIPIVAPWQGKYHSRKCLTRQLLGISARLENKYRSPG